MVFLNLHVLIFSVVTVGPLIEKTYVCQNKFHLILQYFKHVFFSKSIMQDDHLPSMSVNLEVERYVLMLTMGHYTIPYSVMLNVLLGSRKM